MLNKDIILRFFKGSSTIQEEKELFDWLKQDHKHVEEFLRERKGYDLQLLSESPQSEPMDINEYFKIKQHIELRKKEEKETIREKKRIKMIRFIRYISGTAAAIVFGLMFWQVVSTEEREKTPELAQQETIRTTDQTHPLQATATNNAQEQIIKTRKGQRQSVRLPDNTLVWLNAETELRYNAVFSEKKREVWLSGEAFFEVTHDPKRQFIVHTQELDIKVYGTSFNVNAYNNETKKSYTLVNGSIKLSLHDKKEEEVVLFPGQQATYDSGKMGVKEIDTSTEISWKEGKFYFKAEPFAEICNQLERTYDVNIRIEGDSLKKIRFTGQFTDGESLEHILSIMSQNRKMTVEISGKEIHIKEKQ